MNILRKLLKKLRCGKKGQTATEYALVIAVVAAVIIGAAAAVFRGDDEKGVKQQIFQNSIDQVQKTIDATGSSGP